MFYPESADIDYTPLNPLFCEVQDDEMPWGLKVWNLYGGCCQERLAGCQASHVQKCLYGRRQFR